MRIPRTLKPAAVMGLLVALGAAGCGGTLELIPAIVVIKDAEGEQIVMYRGGPKIELDHAPSDILQIAWDAINDYKDDLNDRYAAEKLSKDQFEEKLAEIDTLAQDVGGMIGVISGIFSGRSDEQRALAEARAIIEIFDRLAKIKKDTH